MVLPSHIADTWTAALGNSTPGPLLHCLEADDAYPARCGGQYNTRVKTGKPVKWKAE